MSNAIDLCQLSDVRGWLQFLPPVAGTNQPVTTTITAPSSFGPGVATVTPTSMAGICVNTALQIDVGSNSEFVIVSSITGTTFTAFFANAHTSPVTVIDQTDNILSRSITAASFEFLRRTGYGNITQGIPSASPFVAPVSYNEWYDGNGNDRLYLLNYPITAVTSLTIYGAAIQASTSPTVMGYVIDQSAKCLILRNYGSNRSYDTFYGTNGVLTSGFGRGPGGGAGFATGTQNINVQYTAGYASTPFDITDAVIRMVATNYKRRNYIDQYIQNQPGEAGSVTYRSWEFEPSVMRTIRDYTRNVMVGA